MRAIFFIALALLLVLVTCHEVDVNVNVRVGRPHHVKAGKFHQLATERFLQQFASSHKVDDIVSDEDGAEVDAATRSGRKIRVPFESCAEKGDLASDIQIFSTVWPPTAGSSASIEVKGKLSTIVRRGTMDITAKIFFFSKNFSEAIPAKFLPIQKGPFTLTHSFVVPESPMHGQATATVKILTPRGNQNQQVTCIRLTLDV